MLGERKYEEALRTYEEALETLQRESGANQTEKQTSLLVSLLNNKALVYMKMNEWTRSIDECELVLSLDSQNMKALMRRGTCFQKMKNWRRAKRDYEVVVGLDPESKEAKETLMKIKSAIAEIKDKTLGEMVRPKKEQRKTFSHFIHGNCGNWMCFLQVRCKGRVDSWFSFSRRRWKEIQKNSRQRWGWPINPRS